MVATSNKALNCHGNNLIVMMPRNSHDVELRYRVPEVLYLVHIPNLTDHYRSENEFPSPRKRTMAHQADAKRALDERGYSGTLIRGDNPLKLFEKAVRDRIIDSYYWKEQCFGLNAATLLDRAVELSFIGGTYGAAQKPTPFLCLAFKLLQLTPEREIITFYLEKAGDEFKYLRALAAFYIRLAWEKDEEVYTTLEPFLADGRKLKRRVREGWALTHMDEFIDDLLTKTRVCATTLPKINTRLHLEDADKLEPRESALGDELEELDRDEDDEDDRSSDGEAQENGHARSDGHDSEDGRRGNDEEMSDAD